MRKASIEGYSGILPKREERLFPITLLQSHCRFFASFEFLFEANIAP